MVVEEEVGGWQSLMATPLVPRSQVRLLEVAVTNQSSRSGTRNTDFSDTATNSSFDEKELSIVWSLISKVIIMVHFSLPPDCVGGQRSEEELSCVAGLLWSANGLDLRPSHHHLLRLVTGSEKQSINNSFSSSLNIDKYINTSSQK